MSKGYIYILLCFLFLGIGTPVSKDAVAVVPPWLFMVLTLAIGCAVMVPIALATERPTRALFNRTVLFGLVLQSLLGAVLYTVFILYGLTYSSTITAGIVTSITPAVTFVLSMLILGEGLSMRKLVAVLLAVGGLLLVGVLGVAPGQTASTAWGILFMVLSVLSVSTFFVAAKRLAVELPPATMTAALLAVALVLSLPLGLMDAAGFDWSTMTPTTWWETAFYGVFVWALPFFFTYLGIRTIPASTVGMATAITPVAAIVTAVALFGETLRVIDMAALACVLASILIAESQEAPAGEAKGASA